LRAPNFNSYNNLNSMETNLEFLKIDNLRSIVMSENIDLKPITILIGKNSAGKSTFARSFPLIRQSCEAKKRAPILWFGDRVDFGSFDESLRRNKLGEEEILFTFGLYIGEDKNFQGHLIRNARPKGQSYKATVELGVVKAINRPSQASRIVVNALGFEVTIKFTKRNTVESIECGAQVWRPESNEIAEADYASILPKLVFYKKAKLPESEKFGNYVQSFPYEDLIHTKIAQSGFAEIEEFIVKVIAAAPPLERGSLAQYVLMRLPYAAHSKKIDREQFYDLILSLEEYALINRINSVLEALDIAISQYYTGVKYIEPLRATAQRYYRKQELAVDEIDSKGENLAMFLDSITGWRLTNFNRWTMTHFGFLAKTKNEGGHVTIVIVEDGAEDESNLADIGFGFSQILPVITQIWLSTSHHFFNSKETTSIVIEQPELHLHPSFQAKLADVFAATVSGEYGKTQRLIVETHSNHIVNRLGQLINQGKLRSDDVQILIFEKATASTSEIKVAGYNEKGYLKNWPIGFFEPEA
jgi:predicted ATPase